jgi:hypothetical protein
MQCRNCGHVRHTETTVHQWEIAPDDLIEAGEIGIGGRGTVCTR